MAEETGEQEVVAKKEVKPAEALEVVEEVEVTPPPSVDVLVGEAISSLPKLSTQLDSLKLVMTVFSTYVGSPDIQVIKVDRDTALLELGVTQEWDEVDIGTACERVMDGIADDLLETQMEFVAATGTEVEADDFDAFQRRYTEERGEQAGMINLANQLLSGVKNISGQLGIPNPDPGARPDEKSKRGNFLSRASMAAIASGKTAGRAVLSPLVEFPDEKEGESEPPSWLTESVLDTEDRDLKLLQVVQGRLEGDEDIKRVWDTLERLGLDREAMTALLERVAVKARDQLAQSKEVLDNVAADYRLYAGKIEAMTDLTNVVHQVHNFFFPKETGEPAI